MDADAQVLVIWMKINIKEFRFPKTICVRAHIFLVRLTYFLTAGQMN